MISLEMAVVVCPRITNAVKTCIELLEDVNVVVDSAFYERILPEIKTVTDATYPPPRTKPSTRLVLPILIEGLSSDAMERLEDADKLYVRRYISNFLKRDFPEVFPIENRVPRSDNEKRNFSSGPPKRNKDKYNKETRPKRKNVNDYKKKTSSETP
jgi:hypothetical protein